MCEVPAQHAWMRGKGPHSKNQQQTHPHQLRDGKYIRDQLAPVHPVAVYQGRQHQNRQRQGLRRRERHSIAGQHVHRRKQIVRLAYGREEHTGEPCKCDGNGRDGSCLDHRQHRPAV